MLPGLAESCQDVWLRSRYHCLLPRWSSLPGETEEGAPTLIQMKRNALTPLQVKPSDSSRHDAGGIRTRGGEEGQHSRWGEFVQPLWP